MSTLDGAIASLVTPGLNTLGFRKRSRGIYTTELAKDILGWIGLNRGTAHMPAGVADITPVVGVRHQAVERMVADLRGLAFHPYVPPTLGSHIGYVMPERRYAAWTVDTRGETASRVVASMIEALKQYGLPYMQASSDLLRLCALLDEDGPDDQQASYRRPVAWYLAGYPAKARSALEQSLSQLDGRSDPAATLLRSFADNLNRLLAA
ncbi:MAG: hypothetical protein ABI725_02830 [Chloroflexota bacterium]